MVIMLIIVKDVIKKCQLSRECPSKSYPIISLSLLKGFSLIIRGWWSWKLMIIVSSLITWTWRNIRNNSSGNRKGPKQPKNKKKCQVSTTTMSSKGLSFTLVMLTVVTIILSFKIDSPINGWNLMTLMLGSLISISWLRKLLEGRLECMISRRRSKMLIWSSTKDRKRLLLAIRFLSRERQSRGRSQIRRSWLRSWRRTESISYKTSSFQESTQDTCWECWQKVTN